MIPLLDKKRVKLPIKKADKDIEFIQATYTSFNHEDYIVTQSHTKETVGEFWRMIWQDSCKLIICMVESGAFGDDADKCFQYFPTAESTPITCLGKFGGEKEYIKLNYPVFYLTLYIYCFYLQCCLLFN